MYPILYLISELAYPGIRTPDIVPDIIPVIGNERSDVGVLIPDIGLIIGAP